MEICNSSIDKAVRHVIQTILSQIVDVNNHVRTTQENKELSEGDKIATTNFAHYHTLVLSILLHDLEDIALEKFPNAKEIIDWARSHYQLGLEKGSFKLCKCAECPNAEEAKQIDATVVAGY
jgi:hypothetical protein